MKDLEKEAKKMTSDILSSVGKENDPVAIIVEGYILKKLTDLVYPKKSIHNKQNDYCGPNGHLGA